MTLAQASPVPKTSHLARLDLWGKGHRVTRGTEEFQRLLPVRRGEESSLLEAAVDRYNEWPTLLDSLHKGAARSLREQYCVRITEHEAAVAVPHATRDAHDRPSVLICIVYLCIDWTNHEEIVDRICAARTLAVRVGSELVEALSGASSRASEDLRNGTFLAERTFDLHKETLDDRSFWMDLFSAVARFRGIDGIATPRMAVFGANVIVGTRTEAERAGCDGFFDQRSRRLIPIGERLVTWQGEEPRALLTQGQNPPDLVTHVLEIRDRLERVEASVDRIATQVEGSATRDASRKVDAMHDQIIETHRKVDEVDRHVEQIRRQSHIMSTMLEAMFDYVKRFIF